MPRQLSPELIQDLAEGASGLTEAQVAERRARYGGNVIAEVQGNPLFDLARDTAKDPMIWFLVGTGLVYALLREALESITLFLSILPLIGMDAYLHRRTRASVEGLGSRLASVASVVRGGAVIVIPASEVVTGDLVRVAAGDPFPADGIITGGENLQVDESTLTGESFPVRKRPIAVAAPDLAAGSIDGAHWGLAGTRLLTGHAELRIAFTGGETLYGGIVRSSGMGGGSRTPIQLAVSRLVVILTTGAAGLCLLVGVVRLSQGYGWLDALVSAATLAVAALPEEFPVVLTVFLGVGVYRLARQQALVRRAVSVENIGRVSCICSDKTGTITEGRLSLAELVPAEGMNETDLLGFASIASRRDTYDPLDTLILDAAAARGAPPPSRDVLAIFPFTEDRRRETAIVRCEDGHLLAATKGSPESILALCVLEPSERDLWMRKVTSLSEAGRKVIACARRPLPDFHGSAPSTTSPLVEPASGYVMAGLLACADPVREGVGAAIEECREAGIHVVMVTGDHPATARAVAREVHLGGGAPTVITGDDFARQGGVDGPVDLMKVDVVARALPAQKLALVRVLQGTGNIVAVTGDGVNDVPALQCADIGIAMGGQGTRSAREVASIVLLNDNFRTIVSAIREGRQLFSNLQRSFQYLTMMHIPLVFTAALIPLAGFPLLYLPIHIVWLEMIIHPTALLVFQDLPAGRRLGATRSLPRHGIFAAGDWALIASIGTQLTLLISAVYFSNLGSEGSIEHARASVLATLTVASAFLAAGLSGLRSTASRLIAGGTIATSVLLIQIPAIAARLHLKPLHADEWGIAVGGGLLAVGLPLGIARVRTWLAKRHR